MTRFTDLLPPPQEITPAAGICPLSVLERVAVSGVAEEAAAWLRRDLAMLGDLAVDTSPAPPYRARFGRRGAAAGGDLSGRVPPGPEAYALQVDGDGIEVAAGDAAGLWYGLQTAVQLLRAGGDGAAAGEIRDWPAIRRRGIHLDLKGYQPRFERLLEFCHLLSRFRVNAILLEVEDKLAYSGAPEVGVPGAYTPAQLCELGQLCRALGIEVIPKLQCLGHVDYLLKHERYAHLRENGHPFQYCPRNEEGMDLWRAMAGELMDCFGGHGYFHIGADETGNLGECPVCREHSKASSYIHRVQQCIDVVLQAGRQPILWEDILRNLHGNLSEDELDSTWTLGRDAVLMYWAYGYGGVGNTFPLLPRYLARDMKVWGASGFSGCGPSWIQNVPPLPERALNISAWTKTAVENELEGVVATGWTRIASADPPAEPPEACWFTMLLAAESMWCGSERPLDAFCRSASRALFGADLSGPYGSYLTSGAAGDLPGVDVAVEREAERFALFAAGAAVAAHDAARRDLQETARMYSGRLGEWMPDYRQGLVRSRLQSFEESLKRRRRALAEALEALYEPHTVADVVGSRFGGDAELIERTRRALERTATEPPGGPAEPGEAKP